MLEHGDLALRETTYPAAIAMIAERLLFGWGPIVHRDVLHIRSLFGSVERCSPHAPSHPRSLAHFCSVEIQAS